MGAIADSIATFAQPLLDQTDGSLEQMNKAMSIAMLCWNMALLPAAQRDEAIDGMRTTLQMEEHEFAEFRRSIVDPMIRRHEEMFPRLHGAHSSQTPMDTFATQTHATAQPVRREYARAPRNAPCPCNSGRKYKACCGR